MTPPTTSDQRREFLRRLFWTAGACATGGTAGAWVGAAHAAGAWPARPATANPWTDRGPLGQPDALGLRLPAGLHARAVAVTGERPAAGSSYRWHLYPDGGATFALPDGGWVYTNNSEVPLVGGVGALRFDASGEVVDAYRLLSGTNLNCAGGKTPWGTWLSAEEHDLGRVFECWPTGTINDARPRPALGIFKHEAVAVDPVHRILYLTEDASDGRFYRFVCSERDWPASAVRPALQEGRLQVLTFSELADNAYPSETFDVMQARQVRWTDVGAPRAAQSLVRSAMGSRAPGTVFKGGEGLWYFEGIVYFSTKGDNRIWAYDHVTQTLQAIYDFARADDANRVLSGVDNLTVSPWGDVLVAEDGGNMELCIIRPDRQVQVLLQVVGQDGSELTGPAFSPDGARLYFNSQRGSRSGRGNGITYEVRLG